MTSSPRKEGGSHQNLSPSFFSYLEEQFNSRFLDECAKIATFQPHLDGEEIEARAMETVMEFFYVQAVDRLPFYLVDEQWRVGLE